MEFTAWDSLTFDFDSNFSYMSKVWFLGIISPYKTLPTINKSIKTKREFFLIKSLRYGHGKLFGKSEGKSDFIWINLKPSGY